MAPAADRLTRPGRDPAAAPAVNRRWAVSSGELYRETPEYGMSEDFEALRGKPQEFDCKVDAHTWHHEGRLSINLLVEEVYERVQ